MVLRHKTKHLFLLLMAHFSRHLGFHGMTTIVSTNTNVALHSRQAFPADKEIATFVGMEATRRNEVECLATVVEATVYCWRTDYLDSMKEEVEEEAKGPASAVVGQGRLLAVMTVVLAVGCDLVEVEEREGRCSMEVEHWDHHCLASMSVTSPSDRRYQLQLLQACEQVERTPCAAKSPYRRGTESPFSPHRQSSEWRKHSRRHDCCED